MNAPRPPIERLLARGLLALLLLFAQQTAVLHWLSHAVDATEAHSAKAKAVPGSAPFEHCDECLALGALGSAATATLAAPPSSSAQHLLRAAPAPAVALIALRLAFRSRAPPALS